MFNFVGGGGFSSFVFVPREKGGHIPNPKSKKVKMEHAILYNDNILSYLFSNGNSQLKLYIIQSDL